MFNPFARFFSRKTADQQPIERLDLSAIDAVSPDLDAHVRVNEPDALTRELADVRSLVSSKISAGDFDEYAVPLIDELFAAVERVATSQIDAQQTRVERACNALIASRAARTAANAQHQALLDRCAAEREQRERERAASSPARRQKQAPIAPTATVSYGASA